VIPWVVVLAAGLLLANPCGAQSSPTEADPGVPAEDSGASEWRFVLRPYMYLSGLSGSITAGPITFPINSSFGDIFDNLRIGGFLGFTAEKGQWGIYSDFQYISLIGESESRFEMELELENVIGEVDATFRPGGDTGLKFLAGVRVYSIDQTLRIRGEPLFKANTTVIDPVVGAHGSWALSNRWHFDMRGDVGGFGVSSEATYQLALYFRWDVSRSVGIPFGYRILGYQIKDDDVWMNTRMSGLVLGLDFRF